MSKVVGIASLLYEGPREEVLRYWDLAEQEYGSIGVRTFAHPNIGFQGASCDDVEALEQAIHAFAKALKPIDLIVDGFGYFDSPGRVIYLKVKKTRELEALHTEINRLLERHCHDLFGLYTPSNWVPHITVAMGDLKQESLEAFKAKYEGHRISFRQSLSNLALVEFTKSGQVELIRRYERSS